ncbi:MAG: molybdopterin-dependent oxidoreductase [Methylococcales bacterium]|nr:molybdopterin-dependent oxidoreductase [Methylococcales bacterium]
MNESTKTVKTTCPYCGVGCGVLATLDEHGIVTVKGDPEHPANAGRLCSKGTALGETVYLSGRLLYPEIEGQQVSWDQAISTVAGRFKDIIDEHGPDSVAFYVSGQLLTEDYYVVNKLMKGFIGSANIDTNSRLCMSSPVAAHKRAFGEDIVPGCYEDLDHAQLIVLAGSNTAWCHPVIYQRINLAKKNNPDLFVVLIDPRATQTVGFADLHLSIKPGQDSTLFNGLLTFLEGNGDRNELFTANFTSGLEPALAAAKQSAPSVEAVAALCGLPVENVQTFYQKFADTERVVTAFSQGLNQSNTGVDNVNSVINCHLLTGRIGRKGMGLFSLTGQPNAMGGREVGGLANQLAAHMEIGNPEHRDCVQRFWQSPVIAEHEGAKAVDLFNAVASGKIKAIWIIATNPVVSLPDADRVKAALEQCELVVASDCVRETDTLNLAHIKLPALTWGERDGTVTNSERCISRQRPLLPIPGQAKNDWWILTQVAQKMGFSEHFNYHDPVDIFREHAALSGFENEGRRLFDISGLANVTWQEYEQLAPMQWPINAQNIKGKARLFSDGQFSTANGKARFIAIQPKAAESTPSDAFPYILNTGRVRDHWHTMTRTGVSPRLSAHSIEPYLEIHPEDMQAEQLVEAGLVSVRNALGRINVRVKSSTKQQKGSVFIPIHWSDRFAKQGRVGTLIKASLDPISGQPDFKHSVVAIEKCEPNWHGFILTRRDQLDLQYSQYWVRSRGRGLWRYEIAGNDSPSDWAERAHALLSDEHDEKSTWAEFYDTAQGHFRAARFINGRLESCLFIGSSNQLPERDWLISLFQKDELSPAQRKSLLMGNPPAEQEDAGKVICACFNVGEKSISAAMSEQNLSSVEAIGACLQAGTNCGSCVPELKDMLRRKGIISD